MNEHRKNLQFIIRTPGRSEIKMMASLILMWLDAKTPEEKEMIVWGKDQLTKFIKGEKPEGEEATPASPWSFGK